MIVKSNLSGSASFLRVAGFAGLGFALFIVLANLILAPAGLPRPGTDGDEAIEFFISRHDLVAVAMAPAPLGWFCAVLFGAGALAALRPAERATGEGWSLAGFAGLLLQNATFTVVVGIRYALGTLTAADGTSAGLWALHDALLTLNGTFLALALVGLSIAGRRGGLIRPWHAAIGFLSAALQFTAATITPLVIDHPGPLGLIGLTGWLLWAVWFVTYGVALIRVEPALQIAH
ncbi:hypothetical protein ACFQZZ_30760 [Nocardia sp. GCM10030253]|uniref:hypothetical protein n=1 Tax=Nocardia sp. GCM10030253 TaxID=3273404 RepID=UPI00363110C9